MHTYTPHHLHSRYANGPADPHAVQESGHNIFLSKILPLMLGALVVMKAVGLRECRLLFQSFILQSVVEYTLLATPLECFITRQIPEVGSTPLSHTHTHTRYKEPSHHACGGYESQLDAISSAGGAI